MDLLMFDVVLETDGVSSELLPLDEPRTEIRKRTYKNGNDVIRIHDETSFSTSCYSLRRECSQATFGFLQVTVVSNSHKNIDISCYI